MRIDKVTIELNEQYGWKKVKRNKQTLWFKGHLFNNDIDSLITQNLFESIENLHGHFSFIYQDEKKIIFAVDKANTHSLSYIIEENLIFIGDSARVLLSKVKKVTPNERGVKIFRMCGYTLGNDTLYKNLHTLRPAQICKIEDNELLTKKYFHFHPWNTTTKTYDQCQLELKNLTTKVFLNLIESLGGKQIVVPISGGYDSRVVLSTLYNLNYKNIICFSYGKKGNFEASIGKTVAERMGYPWIFIPLSRKKIREHVNSPIFREYLHFSDTCSSLPFFQDNYALHYLKENKLVSDDAVFINGNSGDFISGGHISQKSINKTKHKELLDELISKHCSLWEDLITDENTELVSNILKEELVAVADNQLSKDNSSLLEFIEFENRQTKFVISGQRNYEFYGYDWRLPLWDDLFLKFWQQVPTDYKIDQRLYKDTFKGLNWGNAWKDIPLNKKYISPKWIVPIRLCVKIIMSFRGKENWKKLDRRLFLYFIESLGLFGQWSYKEIVLSKRNARNIVSWRSHKYLKEKGLI